jgi:hypothetical protein
VTHTEGTTALAAIEWQIDIVLEQTRHTVVGEPLAQFDHRYEPGGDRQVLGDMAQSPGLFLVRLLAIRGSRDSLFTRNSLGRLLKFGDRGLALLGSEGESAQKTTRQSASIMPPRQGREGRI